MKRFAIKITRIITTIFAGLMIAASFPARGDLAQSAAAAGVQAITPATPQPKVFFEPARGAPSGSQPFVVILCKFAGAGETWQTVADFEKLLFGEAGVDAYWREASYGQINLAGSKVVGWYTLPQPAEAYRTADGSDMDLYRLSVDCAAAADADIRFPDYTGIGMAFNRNLDVSSRGGKACLDLDGHAHCYGAFWLWPANSRNRAVAAHEIGHAFGLSHSMTVNGAEFGDVWDVMSKDGQWWPDPHFNPAPQHMIAYAKDRLGCIPPARKFTAAGGTQTVTLERLAQPRPAGFLMAQIPIADSATHFYTVEARRQVGFDANLPADAIVIHETDTEREAPAVLVSRAAERDQQGHGSMWKVGQRFSDAAHGITIAVDAETVTGFVVTITVD